MRLFSTNENYTLYNDNMLNLLQDIESCSIDSIITDPPYELGFMGKSWDSSGVAFQKSTWQKCFDALKPGGYMLVFGGSRTFHRIACAIEDAGFEIRDTIMWLYGSGFPKSMNIGLAVDKKNGVESPIVGQNQNILKKQAKDLREGHRKLLDSYNDGASDRNNGFKSVSADIKQAQNEWDGWGTQRKPAYEPIIVARKPCEGSCVDNVLKWGVGGINIDGCRIPTDDVLTHGGNLGVNSGDTRTGKALGMFQEGTPNTFEQNPNGRFPSNVILSYDDETYDEVCGGMPYSEGCRPHRIYSSVDRYDGWGTITKKSGELIGYDDHGGSASRYFYCAKASKRDRDEGLDAFETKQCTGGGGGIGDYLDDVNSASGKFGSEKAPHKNIHPTVKPTSLMQYLIRLVTPKGGTILDPFNGSGSTGKAVMWENRDRNLEYRYIGIELSEEYCEISKARIEYAMGVEYIPVDESAPITSFKKKSSSPVVTTNKFF